MGIPSVLFLLLVIWGLTQLFFRDAFKLAWGLVDPLKEGSLSETRSSLSPLEQGIVLFTLAITVILWLGSGFYGKSVAEVSFVPIVLLTVTGIIRSTEIREIPWDTLLLVMGGLSLGDSIAESGLALQLAKAFPVSSEVPFLAILSFSFFSVLFSNFMSNTAAAAILIPLANQIIPDHPLKVTLIVALSASAATLLPISTPPHALAAATGYVQTRDFMKLGACLGLIAPLVLTLFIWFFA
jgi:sodium-dependent dicarboxylate transporter 2/3/5